MAQRELYLAPMAVAVARLAVVLVLDQTLVLVAAVAAVALHPQTQLVLVVLAVKVLVNKKTPAIAALQVAAELLLIPMQQVLAMVAEAVQVACPLQVEMAATVLSLAEEEVVEPPALMDLIPAKAETAALAT